MDACGILCKDSLNVSQAEIGSG